MKIEIDLDHYIDLRKTEIKMILLEQGGVEDWEWYGDSIEGFELESEKLETLIRKNKCITLKTN